MKKIIACLLLMGTLVCLFGCGGSKKEEETTTPSVVDGYFTYELLEDGTYAVKATDTSDFPDEVTIPSSFDGIAVTAIADSGFSQRANLRKITVPESISRLPYAAFYMCPDLEVVDLPKTITGIGQGALGMCEKKITIYFDGTTEQWEKISKAGNWDSETKYYVSCSDGTVE